MTITPEAMRDRHGVNVGFFYLLEKGAATRTKVHVYVMVGERRGQRNVWDGKRWRAYEEFEPDPMVDAAIEACREFNGEL